MLIEEAEHLAGGIEQRRGIVIARRDHNVPAPHTSHAAEKAVIELQRPIARRAVVKDIPGNETLSVYRQGEWFDLWSDDNVYWMTWGGQEGKRCAVESIAPAKRHRRRMFHSRSTRQPD